MPIHFMARDDDSMRNGSFYKVQNYTKKPSFAVWYINGDYMGLADAYALPAGLKRYEVKDAKKLIPKGC